MTTNELVKLTMLWTTGPNWYFLIYPSNLIYPSTLIYTPNLLLWYSLEAPWRGASSEYPYVSMWNKKTSCGYSSLSESMVSEVDFIVFITKTCLYNFDPLKPHFHIVKLGFTEVYIIFLLLLKNIDCGYSLEPPQWGGSKEYPQSMVCIDCGYSLEPPRCTHNLCFEHNLKNIRFFYPKILIFGW